MMTEREPPAVIQDNAVLCGEHWKKLARITPAGIWLWCKDGKHEVLLPWAEIELYRRKSL